MKSKMGKRRRKSKMGRRRRKSKMGGRRRRKSKMGRRRRRKSKRMRLRLMRREWKQTFSYFSLILFCITLSSLDLTVKLECVTPHIRSPPLIYLTLSLRQVYPRLISTVKLECVTPHTTSCLTLSLRQVYPPLI